METVLKNMYIFELSFELRRKGDLLSNYALYLTLWFKGVNIKRKENNMKL